MGIAWSQVSYVLRADNMNAMSRPTNNRKLPARSHDSTYFGTISFTGDVVSDPTRTVRVMPYPGQGLLSSSARHTLAGRLAPQTAANCGDLLRQHQICIAHSAHRELLLHQLLPTANGSP